MSTSVAARTEWDTRAETLHEGLRTVVAMGDHQLVADEPLDLGGTNDGPTPTRLLIAALGSCTTMTLQMYAKRKGWPLESAIVHLRVPRRHSGAERAVIERTVQLIGPLSPEQRGRLMEIADRCPVHRMITEGVVVTTLVDP